MIQIVGTRAGTVKMALALEARVFMVEHGFRCVGVHIIGKTELVEMFPESHVQHCNTMRLLIDKFRETVSVADKPRHEGHEC
jgi:hypothetical protein